MQDERNYKIYVTKRVKDILSKDAELFGFRKNNGKININAFLNTLIVNYIDTYENQMRKQKETILEQLQYFNVKIKDMASLSNALVHTMHSKKLKMENEKYSERLSLKPTKQSSHTILQIEQLYLEGLSESVYFRDMFVLYTSMPQDEREKIIFSPIYTKILQAIQTKKKVLLTTYRKSDLLQQVSPYAISPSKEELFNYVLCEKDNQAITYRLSNISNVLIQDEPVSFSNQVKDNLQTMAKLGPQYVVSDATEAIVYLTDKGKEMFETHYVHRPALDKKEDNYYYFSCSLMQIELYFKRFGKEAHIISPIESEQYMKHFYQIAYKEYNKDRSFNNSIEVRTFSKPKK